MESTMNIGKRLIATSLVFSCGMYNLFAQENVKTEETTTTTLFSCGVEGYDTWIPERKERLAKLKKTCDENGVEIIPIIWSIGYGTMLAHNPNYVEGLPIKDMPYVAKGNKAYVMEDKGVHVVNCDFEKHNGDTFAINGWIDAAGQRSFADTEVKHSGECSVRLENFAEDKHGHGRICIEVKLRS